MDKVVLNAASCYNHKYYFNPDMEKLPEAIKQEVKTITVCLAEKLHCIFSIGFYENGELYFETQCNEDDFDFDTIGAELEISKLQREDTELIKSLELWYKVFIINNGNMGIEEL